MPGAQRTCENFSIREFLRTRLLHNLRDQHKNALLLQGVLLLRFNSPAHWMESLRTHSPPQTLCNGKDLTRVSSVRFLKSFGWVSIRISLPHLLTPLPQSPGLQSLRLPFPLLLYTIVAKPAAPAATGGIGAKSTSTVAGSDRRQTDDGTVKSATVAASTTTPS